MKTICILIILFLTCLLSLSCSDDYFDPNNPVTSSTGCISGLKQVTAVKITETDIELTLRESINGPATIVVNLNIIGQTLWSTSIETRSSDAFNTLIVKRSNVGRLVSIVTTDYHVTVTCK